MSIGAAYLFPHVEPLTLYNYALLVAVFLNFAFAYWAAFTVTGDFLASAFAAIVFGASPFLGVRLEGHLSVLSAWGLPLVVAITFRWLQFPTFGRTVALPIALAAVAYTDYYYFIYASILVALIVTQRIWNVQVNARPLTATRRRLMIAIAIVIAALVCATVFIAATGGTDTTIAGIRLRMTDTFNARVIAGLLAFVLLVVWWLPTVRITEHPGTTPRRFVFGPAGWIVAGTLGVLLLPLLVASFELWRAGDYSSQTYVWRNAPPGIDVATFFTGNPLHPLFGGLTQSLYRRFGINGIEGAAWVGIAPMIVAACAWRLRGSAAVRFFIVSGALFLVWALGPYLRVLNYNTGLMLPQTALRFVPVLANARIPGRAFAVVQMAVAVLCAFTISAWRRESPSANTYVALAFAFLVVDYWPATRVMTTLDVPSVYATLETLPPGNVLEVPFGIRDGFGEHGSLDHRTLFYQTVHGHDEMSGFIARLSRRTEEAIETDPIVGSVLALSEHGAPTSTGACRASLACSTKYVVIDRAAASPALQSFVEGAFALRPIASGNGRDLYAVEHVPACSCQ